MQDWDWQVIAPQGLSRLILTLEIVEAGNSMSSCVPPLVYARLGLVSLLFKLCLDLVIKSYITKLDIIQQYLV